MDTFHTKAGGATGPPPRTAAASGRDSASQLRSPTMAWWAAARPSVSVTGGQASNTWPGDRSSKAGPRTVISLTVVTTSDSRRGMRAGTEHRGQLLDDGDEGRLPTHSGPGHLEVREGAEQLLEQHPRLHPRHVRPQAHVRAEAERDVRPRLAAQHVEPGRVGPDLLVAVCARVQEGDVVAGGNPLPADLGCGRGGAAEREHRADDAQHLFHGVPEQLRRVNEQPALVRVHTQQGDAAADQVP